MEKYGMFKVLWSHKCNAYFSDLFILEMSAPTEVSEKAIKEVTKYLSVSGEVLNIEYLYPITFDNIVAMKGSGDRKYPSPIVDRFLEMYFTL